MAVGIDEVGRGCLAGPLVVGAVSLTKPISNLKDSKLLSINQRNLIAADIYKKAEYASLGWVWPHEIDELGLTKSTKLAILRALNHLPLKSSEILLDGNYNYLGSKYNVKTIINGDAIVPSISAASVIAKVARDNYMIKMSDYFPAYGFIKNVGYGTKLHLETIAKQGPCLLHRLSFSPLSGLRSTVL